MEEEEDLSMVKLESKDKKIVEVRKKYVQISTLAKTTLEQDVEAEGNFLCRRWNTRSS